MNLSLPQDFAPVIGIVSLAILLLSVIVHIVFAGAVWRHASELTRKPVFVDPMIWAVTTLIGGVFVAGLYWVMHASALSQWGSGTPTSNAEE